MVTLKTIQEILADNIIKLRKARGLTQEGLASKAGVGFRTLQHVEYQNNWPGLETIKAVSGALGVPPESLFLSKLPDPVKVEPSLKVALGVVKRHLEAFNEAYESIESMDSRIQKLEDRLFPDKQQG